MYICICIIYIYIHDINNDNNVYYDTCMYAYIYIYIYIRSFATPRMHGPEVGLVDGGQEVWPEDPGEIVAACELSSLLLLYIYIYI